MDSATSTAQHPGVLDAHRSLQPHPHSIAQIAGQGWHWSAPVPLDAQPTLRAADGATTIFLQDPTLCPDATQRLLPSLTWVLPSWSSQGPSLSPAPWIPLTKAVIGISFPFQKVLRETQVFPSWGEAGSSPGLDLHTHTTKPTAAASDLLHRGKQRGLSITCPCSGLHKFRQSCFAL